MTLRTRKRSEWAWVVMAVALCGGLVGSGLRMAAAKGWQPTSGWGFGREQHYGGDDRGPIIRQKINLGFFGLERSFPLPRWPEDFPRSGTGR
jgi:hypothetical protein